MTQWLAGIAITLIFTLIGVIWKSNQKIGDEHEKRIDQLEVDHQEVVQRIVEQHSSLVNIQERCKQREGATMSETHMRSIFREELRDFEVRIKKELTTSIKLGLIEDGYISPVKPNTRKRNVEKA